MKSEASSLTIKRHEERGKKDGAKDLIEVNEVSITPPSLLLLLTTTTNILALALSPSFYLKHHY